MITNSGQEAAINTSVTSTLSSSSPANRIERPSYGYRFARWLVRNYKQNLTLLLCATGGLTYLRNMATNSSTPLANLNIQPWPTSSPVAHSGIIQGIDSRLSEARPGNGVSIKFLFDHQSLRRFMDSHLKGADYPDWYLNYMTQVDACSQRRELEKREASNFSRVILAERYHMPCRQNAGFEFNFKLGAGYFNSVYKVTSKEGQPFAMKVIDDLVDFEHEHTINRKLLNSNASGTEYLVKITGTSSTNSPLKYLIMEMLDSNLRDFLKGLSTAPDKHRVQAIFRQILKGVQAIHDTGMIHNDLKLENILINSNGDIKIADFGLAEDTTEHIIAENYPGIKGPVIVQYFLNGHAESGHSSDKPSANIDLWCLGIIFSQVFFGEHFSPLIFPKDPGKCMRYSDTFFADCISHHFSTQRELVASRMRSYDEEAAHLFSKLTELGQIKAITPGQALQYPYMQEDEGR
ncbi:protein kinase family protein [Endozoicomonas sp. ONNA2]|uniref:protein kinase family protein n=1 Tax=Endozoicomonas sp. ONNA2 TaxID=2828741 RepID=UPI0021486C63|nr:protein kinase family protein [Endozoicomonas sp. ONNA2]